MVRLDGLDDVEFNVSVVGRKDKGNEMSEATSESTKTEHESDHIDSTISPFLFLNEDVPANETPKDKEPKLRKLTNSQESALEFGGVWSANVKIPDRNMKRNTQNIPAAFPFDLTTATTLWDVEEEEDVNLVAHRATLASSPISETSTVFSTRKWEDDDDQDLPSLLPFLIQQQTENYLQDERPKESKPQIHKFPTHISNQNNTLQLEASQWIKNGRDLSSPVRPPFRFRSQDNDEFLQDSGWKHYQNNLPATSPASESGDASDRSNRAGNYSETPLSISLTTPDVKVLHQIIQQGGLRVTINGNKFVVHLSPASDPEVMNEIQRLETHLRDLYIAQAPLEKIKRRLDYLAERRADRFLWGSLVYLVFQAGVVAKLTFFSRFGWDVMEPITYMLNFTVITGSLAWFQINKVDYTYDALRKKLVERYCKKLCRHFRFDMSRWDQVDREVKSTKERLRVIKGLTNEELELIYPNQNSEFTNRPIQDEQSAETKQKTKGVFPYIRFI